MKSNVMSNLESVGEMIGSLAGMSDGLNEDEYMEGLIRQAHGKATNAFNVAAAGAGAAGALRHVFEYGVVGVTPGRPKFSDPTAPNARLWTHWIAGTGGNMDIGYSFRPATQPNPKPTPTSTGVSSKYLSKLSNRKYIFWNRAFVMETGQTVEIHAKNGDFLFVPFRGQAPRNPLNRKGFVMWNTSKLGPIHATPGRTSKGNFTSFWMNWWAAAGSEMIEQDMRKSIAMDTERVMAEAAKRSASQTLKPVYNTNIHSAVRKAREQVKRTFGMRRRIR